MQDNSSVYAKKIGQICQVYLDAQTDRPLPLASYDDTPVGGFPMTFMSDREVKARYPGKNIVFLEPKPSGKQATVHPIDQDVLNAELQKLSIKTATASKSVAEPTIQTPNLVRNKCKEFLQMYLMASKYASAENIVILEHKIEAIQELTEYVFGQEE